MLRDKNEKASVTRASLVQPLNTRLPNELARVNPDPMLTFSMLVHPWNELSPMEPTLFGITMPFAVPLVAIDVQSWKQLFPRDNPPVSVCDTVVDAMINPVKPEQPLKASSPMLLTDAGNDTS